MYKLFMIALLETVEKILHTQHAAFYVDFEIASRIGWRFFCKIVVKYGPGE